MNEDTARVIAEGFNRLLWEERDRLGYHVDGRISIGFVSEPLKKGGFSIGKSLLKATCYYNSNGEQHILFECSGGCNEIVGLVSYRLFSLVHERDVFDMLVKDEYTSK